MPTFQETQDHLKELLFRKSVIEHLIEYMDENFKSVGEKDPKKFLISDDIKVPQVAFEAIAQELTEMAETTNSEVQEIMEAEVSTEEGT